MRRLPVVFLSVCLANGIAVGQPQFERLRGMLPYDFFDTRSITPRDLDGDGDIDAVRFGFQHLELLRNSGTGFFTPEPIALAQSPDLFGTVLLFDIDGDQDNDLFLAGFTKPTVVAINDGDAGFSDAPAGAVPTTPAGARDHAAADFDGDGDLDVLGVAAWKPDFLLLNNGAGVFVDASANLPVVIDDPLQLEVADLDGDGDLDALVHASTGEFRGYLNNGAAVFTSVTGILPTDPLARFVLTDVDGDADPDAVVASALADRLYVNNGLGTFLELPGAIPPAPGLTGSITGSFVIHAADAEGDGDVDLVAFSALASSQPNLGTLFVNNGTGSFAPAANAFATPPLPDAVFADVDGDDDIDFFTGGPPSEDQLFFNDGSGRFVDLGAPVFEATTAYELSVGDWNGDGFDDLFGSGDLLTNDGSGGFLDDSTLLPPGAFGTTSALADVDGDGDLDGFLGLSSGQTAAHQLLLNNGAAGFTDASNQLPPTTIEPRGYAAADYDFDGDVDLAIANFGGIDQLWLNGGAGVFTDASTQLPPVSADSSSVTAGDVDGDGDLDLVVATWEGQNRLYRNNGAGTFTDVSNQLVPDLDETYDIVLGDVNQDGTLDALGVILGEDRLALNDGTGAFIKANSLLNGVDLGMGATFVDYDGDGDLDIYGTEYRLLKNFTSFGAYIETSDLLPPMKVGATGYTVAHDFDRDGDVDVVHSGALVQLTNLSIQLARRDAPRIGKPLTMDLHGGPGAPWLTGISTATAVQSLPPFGTLLIDPAGLVAVLSGSLDGQGRDAITLPIPNAAGLVGLTVHWQALIGGRLSSRETTTFTDL